MIEQSVSLVDYFNSRLSIFKIDHTMYPKMHIDSSNMIIGCQAIDNVMQIF
jgi:hypothetical protein